ncbi:MAG: SDR family NAD(P)-dependent oxidoreductase [Albidovulum sp.]|nr:SDR family NAD(P)-dependent oxidoreductase [Albidovulum sp.]MDE0529828.1 SDR family NAD(P)-dependent oxidoreductase [Albidovulum sp.]
MIRTRNLKFDFSGRNVLVTGASRGIGLSVAESFVETGARVTLLANDECVESAAASLSERHGADVGFMVCDIACSDKVERALDPIPNLDILVNNAGLELLTPVSDSSPETIAAFERIVSINVVGTYHVTRAALKKMKRGGRIVVTASMWGKTGVAEFGAYCASKHANIGFVRSLAKELGPLGISVNAVCPGWVRTRASMNSLAVMSDRQDRDEKSLLNEITSAQAFGGLMEPADMTETYLFLASDAADNITGQALTVDRGELLR